MTQRQVASAEVVLEAAQLWAKAQNNLDEMARKLGFIQSENTARNHDTMKPAENMITPKQLGFEFGWSESHARKKIKESGFYTYLGGRIYISRAHLSCLNGRKKGQ